MSEYRYSIIPGGAVTDPLLEPRDLQVLCLLGRHTDKYGWCFRSQVKMAVELHCGRATVQRSIDRLCAAGWAEKHERPEAPISANGHPHSYYAYRVVIDRVGEHVDLSKFVVEDSDDAKGCPPVGTSPPDLGTGCPRMHGHHEGPPFKESGGGGARVREAAEKITEEIETIAGIDTAKHAKWFQAGPVLFVQRWLDAGYSRDCLIEGTRRGMAGKHDGPPNTIRYFGPIWQRVRAELEQPIPQPGNGVVENETSRRGHRQSGGRLPRPGSRDDTRERLVAGLTGLRQFVRDRKESDAAADESGGCSGDGGQAPAQLPKPECA